MEDNFVLYKEALALKNLGFDEECITHFYDEEFEGVLEATSYPNKNSGFKSTLGEQVSAPLWQQAFKWFRDNHGYYTSPMKSSSKTKGWIGVIRKKKDYMYETYTDEFQTPEEAELATLRKLIEIIKES